MTVFALRSMIAVAALATSVLAVPVGSASLAQPEQSADRYRPRDPGSLAVTQAAVRCADYLAFVAPDARGFEEGPDRGQYGPRHALAALATFTRTGDRRLAAGIMRTLRHYGAWVDRQIAETGGVFSMEGASLLAIHFRELRARGQVTADDESWLRDTLLKLRRHQYAWQPRDGLWRGSQHHAAAQATNHLLAAGLFPDEPEAARWRTHGETVWNDWWSFRDIGINDISYFSSSLANILRTADLLGRREVFTDPRVQAILWDRLVHETSPDGALVPYGAHAGWHGLAGVRIWALELAARHTRDGRYRFAASRLMNYGRARGFSTGQAHWHGMSVEAIALAAIACDDNVVPVEPDPGSRLLMRPEIVRLTEPQWRERFPGAAGADAGMFMTPRLMPNKLVLRSGWQPGDLFMLVEAYPRHDPLNPTAILGLERWSSSFAEMISEKDIGRENAVRIEDLSGDSQFVGGEGNPRPGQLPTGYDRMETTVEAFDDDALATHARLGVTNYQGFRAGHTREFLFVKNRFVLVRDETRFDDSFRARIGPIWNTQNVGTARGRNWINSWFDAHWYNGALRLSGNPPSDLLIHYAPREDAVVTVADPAPATGPGEGQIDALRHFRTTQFRWEGQVRPGLRLQFVSLLLPHAPTRDASALAESIQVLADEPGLAAVAVATGTRWELVVLNPTGRRLQLPGPAGTVETDARALYLDRETDGALRYSYRGATILTIGQRALHRSNAPADFSSAR